MSNSPQSEVSRILLAWTDQESGERLVPRLFELVYEELRALAANLMRGERAGHTLLPTALVHEAFLRLAGGAELHADSRAHFFGIAARAMRQVLVDHARRRDAEKRGGGLERVTLSSQAAGEPDRTLEILELERVLERFAAVDPRAARVVELRVFGGLTHEEVARVLGVSQRTAEGDWAMGRMWLSRELSGPA